MNLRFNSYEEFLKAIADLAGDFRQATIRNKVSRQMSMASHIVDVLNNKINTTTTFVGSGSNETVKTSKTSTQSSVEVLKSVDAKPMKEQKAGYAETENCVEGNLALSIQNDDVSEEEKEKLQPTTTKSAPFLKLIKNSKIDNNTQQKSNEWTEERSMMKSPVFIIGLILAVMVLLILFW